MENQGGTGGEEDRRRRRHVDTVAVASSSTSLEISCNLPTVSAMYGPQGWADLPDGLLHSIIPLLVSFPDILAFAATCPSWRDAFSYPSKSIYSMLFPPLLLQSDVPLCSPGPRPYSSNLMLGRACYVTNLASKNMYMCCQIPLFNNGNGLPSPLDKFIFVGASYGHLILSNKQSCLVVDVFTGFSVSPPQLPVDEDTQIHHGTLTAPLASPNSHLMVTAGSHNLFWHVGSHSWVRFPKHYIQIKRVVAFKGQVFGLFNGCGLCIVHLFPHIRIEKIAVDVGESVIFNTIKYSRTWLVACGEMLLIVGSPSRGHTFEAFRLDLSTERAKWVKVEKLENWAIQRDGEEGATSYTAMVLKSGSHVSWASRCRKVPPFQDFTMAV